MIKELLLETGHDYRFERLPPKQQNQYDEIIANIEADKSEYMVGVDLANPNSMDYSIISKFRYIDGMLKLISTETLGELPSNFKLGDGNFIGGEYYDTRTITKG